MDDILYEGKAYLVINQEINIFNNLKNNLNGKLIADFPVKGDNLVQKVMFDPSPPLPNGERANSGEIQQKELKSPGYITANPYTYGSITNFREDLKKNPTEAERVMWGYLRNKKTGFKIRRQHVIDDFIVDFVCLSKKTIIEIDGRIHDFQKDKDTARTIRLKVKGFDVIRFSNAEVMQNPQKVAEAIKLYLASKENDNIKTSIPDQPEDQILESSPMEGQGEIGRVFINEFQYFNNVPLKAWNFCINGRYPVQSWLETRKDKKLEKGEISDYQNLIIRFLENERVTEK
ncbi:MAG: DUF559 domain-containing protein [Bacteroidales bacterium]